MDVQNPLMQTATTEPTKIILPGQVDPRDPVRQLNEHGTEKFSRKEEIYVPPPIMHNMRIQIPPVYYWEDVNTNGTSCMMTMAFRWGGRNWGMSMPIEDQNFVKIEMSRKKLFSWVKATLDVLVHHGDKVLDRNGNIDPRLVNDEEAIRYRFDKDWDKKVAAFNSLVRVAPITRKKAVKLKLLDESK